MKNNLKKLMKVVSCTIAITMLLFLVGCDKKDELSYKVQYIQTNGTAQDVVYPQFEYITTKEELTKYYNDNKDNYNFSDSLGTSQSFTTAIDKYDENYFKDSFLIAVILEENSSSIFHKVTDVSKDGKIVIEKTVPNDDNTDTANWHILVELDKEYQDSKFQLEFKEILLTKED